MSPSPAIAPEKNCKRLIASSQFTVFPSHAYETFGKSILESYAQGRAVVASDLGSRRELVRDAETGIRYKPGNVDELGAAIRLLYDRPELSKRMGEAGWELVRDKHSQRKTLPGAAEGLSAAHREISL